MVRVTPEVSSSAVLMVGSHSGPTVWNGSTMPAGDAVTPTPLLGHTALKSCHSSALSRLASCGTECARAHHKAVKKAPKNMTSEKMNQLMLQRYDRSMRRPYRPPSLSRAASRIHWNSTNSHHASPKASEYAPQPWPLIHMVAPRMTKNRPPAAMMGWRESAGT